MVDNRDIYAVNRSVIDGLHRRIGRNLLRFQGIELSLKMMLPYMHPDGGAKGADVARAYRAKHIDGKTLGSLVEQFKLAIAGTPELWEAGLAALLVARNELVHHFYYKFNFTQPDGISEALAYLDEQYEQAEEWWKILHTQSLVFLLVLIETDPGVAAAYGMHREKVLAQLPQHLEFVVPSDPSRTAWATTRVVKLLRLAEQQTSKIEGLTLLSNAGSFIKSKAPDLTVKAYGLKTLKEILLVSGLFHVFVSEQGAMAYCSNDQPVDLTLEGPGALSFSIFVGGSEARS